MSGRRFIKVVRGVRGVRGALGVLGCGNSEGGWGAGVMALNGKRSLTLTEWQSLPLVAKWQALMLFVATFSSPLTPLIPLIPLTPLTPLFH